MRKLILLGILVAASAIGAILLAQYRTNAELAVQAEIQQLAQAFDAALYVTDDYEAAKNAANGIISLAKKSNEPNATEARGLIRLAFSEIAFGQWGNCWKEKVERCEELISQKNTVDHAEFLLYTGTIKGKYQRKFTEGLERVRKARTIADQIEDDRTLALCYLNLSELNKFLGRRHLVARNSYNAVAIAKHHGQKPIIVRTLRKLLNDLVLHRKYTEASACGKDLLKLDPATQTGLYPMFITGDSDKYLHLVENKLETVKRKQKEKSATQKQLAAIGKSLAKLATAYAIREKYSACRKYAELAIPYLKMVDDKSSLETCQTMLYFTQLDLAKTVDEVDEIVESFKADHDETSMSALASAYAKVGEYKKSVDWCKLGDELKNKRNALKLGFARQAAEVRWNAELSSRQAELSNKLAAESQRRVWFLSTALISGLTICALLSGFYMLLRRERNSLEDIVETRTRSLSKAMEAASAADSAKSEFLAQINHEIRNPLTAILGYCDLLSLSKERTTECIAGIESSSLHLRELVDKILEVSKIESSGLELNSINFIPGQTASNINDIMLEQAATKGLRFACSFQGDSNCKIFSDETKIRQIALNLIGNAIKFTETGSVTASFELNKDNASLVIVVKDTGIGIAAEETRAVFDRFAKASNGTARDGSGLGLFITNHLVNCLDGKIELDSELGHGTQVTVSLPVKYFCEKLQKFMSGDNRAMSNPEGSAANPPRRVIIIDDQETIRTSLKLLLDAHGIDCKTTENFEQTSELFKSWQPDLVLLDLRMPKESGYELLERTRQLIRDGVPVYAMTGDATAQVKEKCLNHGFDGFITKPFKINTILEILDPSTEVV